jgi:hypothetical protein
MFRGGFMVDFSQSKYVWIENTIIIFSINFLFGQNRRLAAI